MSERFYKISEVSEMLGIEQHTLRYLENTLKLKINRNDRSDRLYTDSDIDTLKLVLDLKAKGLNTTAIKLALENVEESETTEVQVPFRTLGPEAVELISTAKKIVEQNEVLLEQNQKMEQRIDNLEKKVDQRNEEREKKIDEFLQLWKNEQAKNKSIFSWLRGK